MTDMMVRCPCGHIRGAHTEDEPDSPSTGSGPCTACDCQNYGKDATE